MSATPNPDTSPGREINQSARLLPAQSLYEPNLTGEVLDFKQAVKIRGHNRWHENLLDLLYQHKQATEYGLILTFTGLVALTACKVIGDQNTADAQALANIHAQQTAVALEYEKSSRQAEEDEMFVVAPTTTSTPTSTQFPTLTFTPTKISETATATSVPTAAATPTKLALQEVKSIEREDFYKFFQPVNLKDLLRFSEEQEKDIIPILFSKLPEKLEYTQYNDWMVLAEPPFTVIAPYLGKYSPAGSNTYFKKINFQQPLEEKVPFHSKQITFLTSSQAQIEVLKQISKPIEKGERIATFRQLPSFKDADGNPYPANSVFLKFEDLLYTGGIFPKSTFQNELSNLATANNGKVAVAFIDEFFTGK